MAISDFTIIRRSLVARVFSTVVTGLTVAVAVALLLVLLGMRDAGESAFARGSGNMHLMISRDASPLVSVLNGIYYAGAPARPIEWETYQRVSSSHPWAWTIPTQLGDSYRGRPVLATTRAFFTDFTPAEDDPWRIVEGRVFEAPFEVVVGADAARTLGLEIGDTIALTHGAPGPADREGGGPEPHVHHEYPYRIVGILAPTGSAHDRAMFTNLESSWIIHAHDRRKRELGDDIPPTTADDLVAADRLITGIYGRVATRPGREVSAALAPVFASLRSDPSLTVASPSDQIGDLFAIVSNVDRILIGMAMVVLVSSGISILLALYNSMEQRRRQIAVLRVLGCSRGRVFGLVVTESAVLGLLGAAAGIVLGLVGGVVVAREMQDKLGLVIDPAPDLPLVLALVIGTIALAAVAGVIPAALAYRTSVARALRPIA